MEVESLGIGLWIGTVDCETEEFAPPEAGLETKVPFSYGNDDVSRIISFVDGE